MVKKGSKNIIRKENLVLLIIPLIFIIDRTVKIYAVNGCFGQFCFSRALNNGAAFGILPGQTVFLILIGILVLLITLSIYKKSSSEIKLGLILIAAGTISNMYDRIFFGSVVDVLSVFSSSSFNLADLSNLFGALILIKFLLARKKK